MKSFNASRALLFCALSLFLSACNSGEPEEVISSVPNPEVVIEDVKVPFMKEELLDKKGLVFLAPKRTTVQRSPLGFMLSSSLVDVSPGGKTGATFSRVSEEFERGAADNVVRVTITAKAGEENPALNFAAAYSTNRNGNSGWKTFAVSPEFKTYSFEYKLPKLIDQDADKLEGDFLGVNADLAGDGGQIIVSSVKLEAFKQ